MPKSAVENVAVDNILPVSEIAKILVELAYKPVEEEAEAVSREMEMESDMAELDQQRCKAVNAQERLRPCLSRLCRGTMGTAGRKALDSDAVPTSR